MYRKKIDVDIDEDSRVVRFEGVKPKKITGSRIASILGMNEYTTPFKVACDMARLYSEPPSKYTEAGEAMEPKIRDYVRARSSELIGDSLGGGELDVIDPVPKEQCFYEHFPNAAPFGGMVDGYVDLDGEHIAVLEIKTASDKSKWFGGNGEPIVPTGYLMQTSLYCDLSKLDRIVFAVGFPEPEDYDSPEEWIPSEDNVIVRIVKPLPMRQFKADALAWYNKYVKRGVTPPWTDKDLELVEMLLEDSYYH